MSPDRGAPDLGAPDLFEAAHAKVNLYLHVTGKREDGYHLLDSLAVFAGAADRLSVAIEPVSAAGLSLSLSGPFGARLHGDGDDNLVLRAARLLAGSAAEHSLSGAHLVLEKQLPVASGIGGGSADAAACLRLLRRAWPSVRVDPASLHAIAVSLGADVPVCLAQRPARMQGIGDILLEAPTLPPLGMVLINCGEAVATQAVFRAREPAFSPQADLPRGWSDAVSLSASLALLSNDLEAPALRLCPTIGAVLQALRALPGCLFARMSGSGATCFGLFATSDAATQALAGARLPTSWWCWAGGLHDPAR